MKKRKIFAIIIAMMCALVLLSACAPDSGNRESKDIVEEEEMYGTFIALSCKRMSGPGGLYQYIMYDPETMVMWTFVEGSDCGGLSIIYNADGTPRLYEP